MKMILVDIAATGHDIREIDPFRETIMSDDIHGVAECVRDLIHDARGYLGAAQFACRDFVERWRWHWTYGRQNPDALRDLVRDFPAGGYVDGQHFVVSAGSDGVDPCCGPRDAHVRWEPTLRDDLRDALAADPENFAVVVIE